MKVTFKKLSILNRTFQDIERKHPEVLSTKLGYAYQKFYAKNLEAIFKSYNLALSSIRVDAALTDPVTKEILFDKTPNSRGFKFDKQGLKTVLKSETELEAKWDNEEYEVEPFIVKKEDIPEYISEFELEAFEDIFIPCKKK